MLTQDQKTKYLTSPDVCPYCGSDELSSDKVTSADINRTVQNISCRHCKKRWSNIYTLTKIEEDEWDIRKDRINIWASPSSPSTFYPVP